MDPSMKRNTVRRPLPLVALLALLGLLALSAGCGFKPRGQTVDLTSVPGPLHISGIRPYSPLARELRRQLEQTGIAVVDARADSGSVLRIGRRDTDSRVLSVNSRNKAVEYELEESARIALYGLDGRELVAPQTVRVLRILLRPGETLLGSNREEDLLRADMRRELAERIVRRIAAQR
jgi:LPS-assembly lipoprotein